MSFTEEKPREDISHRARRVIRFYRIMLWLLPLPVSGCLLVGSAWLCDRFHWPSGYAIGAWLVLSFVTTVGMGLFDYQFHRLNPTLRPPLAHVFVFFMAQIVIPPLLFCILGMIVVGVESCFSR